MKIRNGFVSNSSSSSFVIKTPTNISKVSAILDEVGNYDYYVLDNVLYTSFISDCSNLYSTLSELSEYSYEGSHGVPYEESEFIEFEGERGVDSVYIPKSECKGILEAENRIKDQLYRYVKNYIDANSIYSGEFIQEDSIIFEDAPYFLQRCCEIVGYYEQQDWEKENED